ncbi:MBL fold metallo-hydrolase [Singulisphaera sp. PoT]|uniref:MBL fold metallo-hydrolase n=1 Tax=Singulisphaera sp. PoT TaxID=3411797 RepID=UPI003BF58B97
MPLQFSVLASGSQGNSSLVQVGGTGTLIDFGLGPRAIAKRLESVGSSWERISSAFLTHTHGDHLSNDSLMRMAKGRIPLYCHEGHIRGLSHRSGFQALAEAGLIRHYDERPLLTPTGLRVEPVELRHDGGPTYGFRIEAKLKPRTRSVALGYLADTGSWSSQMVDTLTEVDLLGVEFNHDVEMQLRSPRHRSLIARNLGDRGHLSNEQGADFIEAVLDRSARNSVRHVVLLHLSQQCNDPDLALKVARRAVRGKGSRITVHAARQSSPHPNILLEPSRRRSAVPSQPKATSLPLFEAFTLGF